MNDATLRFRRAMARYFDQPLTPQIAAAIEAEAFCEPEQAIDPWRFDAVEHSGYTIRLESFRAILPELIPLHEEHWLETEKYRHGLALNPRYDVMAAREQAGRLVQITVRHGDELAGHLRLYLGESLHTSTAMAEEDTLFIRPAHRGGFLVMALLRYAEDVLRQLGVREIRANSKVVNHADVLMRRMRYREVAIQFVKFIDPPTAAPLEGAGCRQSQTKEPAHAC